MKKYIILLSAAALCLAACTQKADKFDYKQEIALITGTDDSLGTPNSSKNTV